MTVVFNAVESKLTGYFNLIRLNIPRYGQTGVVPSGSGRVVIGRYFSDRDELHGSAEVDELILWNYALSEEQIATLYYRFSQLFFSTGLTSHTSKIFPTTKSSRILFVTENLDLALIQQRPTFRITSSLKSKQI